MPLEEAKSAGAADCGFPPSFPLSGTFSEAVDFAPKHQGEDAVPKRLKSRNTDDADLKHNPMIGGSEGTTISGTMVDDLEDLQGGSTIEGDIENDINPQGAVAQGRVGRKTRTK